MHPMAMGQVQADPKLRAELLRLGETPAGREQLLARLKALDPVTAQRLPIQDVRRIARAIEVSEKTGRPSRNSRSRKCRLLFLDRGFLDHGARGAL